MSKETIQQQRALLESCFEINDKQAGFTEERLEKRLKLDADIDWIGVVSERFLSPEKQNIVRRSGLVYVATDGEWVNKVKQQKKRNK